MKKVVIFVVFSVLVIFGVLQQKQIQEQKDIIYSLENRKRSECNFDNCKYYRALDNLGAQAQESYRKRSPCYSNKSIVEYVASVFEWKWTIDNNVYK